MMASSPAGLRGKKLSWETSVLSYPA
uniref:Uncharacterized protein n=1 Tax=Arundo donax TaxID=35708 RepID=A0A0A8ZF18_ARUDO